MESIINKLNEKCLDRYGMDYEEFYRTEMCHRIPERVGEKIFKYAGYIRNPEDLMELIRIHYRWDDEEFTTGYLDSIRISMTGDELLQAYAEMQKEFNGDYVFMVENVIVSYSGEDEFVEGFYDGIHGHPGIVEGDAGEILRKICDENYIFRFDECEQSPLELGKIHIRGKINPIYI